MFSASPFSTIPFSTVPLTGTSGTVLQTLPTLTQLANGGVGTIGTVSQILPALTQHANGDVSVISTVSQILPTLSQLANGEIILIGTVSQILPSLSQLANGEVSVIGTVSQILPALLQLADDEVAEVNQLLPALTQLANGKVGAIGVSAQLLPTLTQLANGKVSVLGVAAQILPALTQHASGGGGLTGDVIQIFPTLTQIADDYIDKTGTAAHTFPLLVQTANFGRIVNASLSTILSLDVPFTNIDDSITSSLIATQTLNYVLPVIKQQTLTLEQTILSNVQFATLAHNLSLLQSIASNAAGVTLSQTLSIVQTVTDALNFASRKIGILSQIQPIVQTLHGTRIMTDEETEIDPETGTGTRGVLHNIAFTQPIVSFLTDDSPTFIAEQTRDTYNALNTTPPVLTPRDTVQLSYPPDAPTLTLVLPTPILGDREVIEPSRIYRRTTGHKIRAFRKNTWPSTRIFTLEFEGLQTVEKDDFLTFMQTSLYKQIHYRDHEDRTWLGMIINVNDQHRQVLPGCGWVIAFTFEGELV